MEKRLILAVLCIAALACKKRAEDSQVKLIGGEHLDLSPFPSTILLKVGYEICTGAKIAPRHYLTAAHCLVEEFGGRGVKPAALPGQQIQISNDVKWRAPTLNTATIKIAHIHYSYRYASLFSNIPQVSADLAVIETTESLVQIPAAQIGFEPPTANSSVVLAGYGCESLGTNADHRYRLKFSRSHVVNNQAFELGMNLASAEYRSIIGRFYHATKATFFDAAWAYRNNLVWPSTPGNFPTLCPGDSGGPLYLEESDSGPTIVGINSRRRLANDKERKFIEQNMDREGDQQDLATFPVINIHTRLDNESLLRTDRWLQNILSNREPSEQGIAYDSVISSQAIKPSFVLKLNLAEGLDGDTASLRVDLASPTGECVIKSSALRVFDSSTDKWIDFKFQGNGRYQSPKGEFKPQSLQIKFQRKVAGHVPNELCAVSIFSLKG